MNILIDFTQIPIKKVGVGVYALKTFTEMFNTNNEDQFYAIVQDDDSELDFESDNVKTIKVRARIFRSLIARLFLEQLYIPFLSKKYKIDVIHSLHYSYPLLRTRARKVITIHDLTFFIYPHLHQFIKRYYFRWFIKKASLDRNNNLICVSQSTLEDLNKYIPENKSHNYVVPLACEELKDQTLYTITNDFNIERPYILFIGTLEPRKNIEGLIKAYAQLKERTKYQLVIVGKKGWYYDTIFNLINEKKLVNDIVFTSFVNDHQKYCLLKNSSLFVYPSFYEGFGLPVLEAISMGIPTITSNISSLPEVGGDACLLVDPNDITQLSQSIHRVLTDTDLRKSMILKGYYQANKFSWELTAQKTIEIYRNFNDKESKS